MKNIYSQRLILPKNQEGYSRLIGMRKKKRHSEIRNDVFGNKSLVLEGNPKESTIFEIFLLGCNFPHAFCIGHLLGHSQQLL